MKRTAIPVDFRPHVKGSKIINQETNHQLNTFLINPMKRRSFIYDLAKGEKLFEDENYEYYRGCILDLFPTLKPKGPQC